MGMRQYVASLVRKYLMPSTQTDNTYLFHEEDVGYLIGTGKTVPSDAENVDVRKGGLFIHHDGGSATALLYVNVGTRSSCNFDPVTAIAAQGAAIADAEYSHAITEPSDTPADADTLRDDLVTSTIPSIEAALNSHGTKINEIIDALQAAGLIA